MIAVRAPAWVRPCGGIAPSAIGGIKNPSKSGAQDVNLWARPSAAD